MDLFKFKETMLNGLLSKIMRFNTLMLIHITKTTNPQLTAVLSMQLPFKIMITLVYHLNVFKYYNVTFNLNIMTKIHSDPLFG